MSSIEIAELTGKQHGHVMRNIRTMLTELHGDQSRFGAVYRDAKGEERACVQLPYDETMILVTGYSIPLRAAVVRRWREVEQTKPALPNFADPVAAARAWADEVEQKSTAHPRRSDRETVRRCLVLLRL